MNSYQVFHSLHRWVRPKLHIIFVRPEKGGNVGSAARAVENMGVEGRFIIVGSPNIIDSEAERFAKHAKPTLQKAEHFSTLDEALQSFPGSKLSLAATARIGSAHRPHPLRVREAVGLGIDKVVSKEIEDLVFVFGPESDGLTNAEVELCDWICTIPSSSDYRSLNLSQAILIFCYEANLRLTDKAGAFASETISQKERLITHALLFAEQVGFILPGDPLKMRPRLEQILARLPAHIPEAATIHGLLDQAIRSVKKGAVDLKGRYRNKIKAVGDDENGRTETPS